MLEQTHFNSESIDGTECPLSVIADLHDPAGVNMLVSCWFAGQVAELRYHRGSACTYDYVTDWRDGLHVMCLVLL